MDGLSLLLCAPPFTLLGALGYIDAKTLRLPNRLVLALASVGVFYLLLGILGFQATLLATNLTSSVVGCALGAGAPLVINTLYGRVTKKVGFGMGDVKLLGALGIFLGPSIVMVLGLSCFLGVVYVLLFSNLRTKEPFAFGPTIVTATVLLYLLAIVR